MNLGFMIVSGKILVPNKPYSIIVSLNVFIALKK